MACKGCNDCAHTRKQRMQKKAIIEKVAKKLTARGRNQIKEKNFALPGRRYPIYDRSHARAALSMVAKHGTPEEQATVRARVHAKYPGIGKEAMYNKGFYDELEKISEESKGKKIFRYGATSASVPVGAAAGLVGGVIGLDELGRLKDTIKYKGKPGKVIKEYGLKTYKASGINDKRHGSYAYRKLKKGTPMVQLKLRGGGHGLVSASVPKSGFNPVRYVGYRKRPFRFMYGALGGALLGSTALPFVVNKLMKNKKGD